MKSIKRQLRRHGTVVITTAKLYTQEVCFAMARTSDSDPSWS